MNKFVSIRAGHRRGAQTFFLVNPQSLTAITCNSEADAPSWTLHLACGKMLFPVSDDGADKLQTVLDKLQIEV